MGEHALSYLFRYDHLPKGLQEVSRPFAELAADLAARLVDRPATLNAALFKLWEAKNLAVVAAAQPEAK